LQRYSAAMILAAAAFANVGDDGGSAAADFSCTSAAVEEQEM
jgi:hypothetical protein